MTTIISVRLFNYFKTTLYKYITTLFLQKQLICRSRDSCLSLPWPGFEPGLSRPQREVLTPMRSRPLHQLFLHQPWQQIISVRLFNYFKTTPYKYISTFIFAKVADLPHQRLMFISAVTRIRTWVVSATTRSTNHYTITAIASVVLHQPWQQSSVLDFSIILRQLYINIKQHFFSQKWLICRTRDSCLSLPWPGFEPGLSRPQREVLTTIRSRPLHQLFCISHDNNHQY